MKKPIGLMVLWLIVAGMVRAAEDDGLNYGRNVSDTEAAAATFANCTVCLAPLAAQALSHGAADDFCDLLPTCTSVVLPNSTPALLPTSTSRQEGH